MNTNQIEIRFVREYMPKNQKIAVGARPKKNYIFALVGGTAEQLASFKKSKAEHYREDEQTKTPLYFTQRWLDANDFPGKKIFLIETEKGTWVPDTSYLDRLANKVDQYGADMAFRLQGFSAPVAVATEEEEKETVINPAPTHKGRK